MPEKKEWFKYTDEAGRAWRIKQSPALAEIGGLIPCQQSSHPYLSELIAPRYIWIKEVNNEEDKLPARYKVILERGRFKEIVNSKPWPTWSLYGKDFRCLSYYGEDMKADEI